MSELVLIRGIPGSGKTTYAKEHYPNHSHFEADMFFLDDHGNYHFDRDLIKDAHEWCQSMTEKAMRQGKNIVVSNTFVKLWEMDKYRELAKQYGYNVTTKIMTGNYPNVHGVPEEIVERMKLSFESHAKLQTS